MTRASTGGTVVALLAMAGLALPVLADDYFFSEGGYELVLDEPVAPNQIVFQPVGLTAGEEYIDNVALEDIVLRCSVFTGRKGSNAILEGDVAEGDELEDAGSFPPESKKTKKNGYAVFEKTVDDLVPPLSDSESGSFDGPLLLAMQAGLGGNKAVAVVHLACSLGVPSECVVDETTACLHGGRFKTAMSWRDPFDGSRRQATVRGVTTESATFGFDGLPSPEEQLVELENQCGRASRTFKVRTGTEASVETFLIITDTTTGVVRRFGNADILDTEAFDTCP